VRSGDPPYLVPRCSGSGTRPRGDGLIPALQRRVPWQHRQLQRLGEIQRHQRGDVGSRVALSSDKGLMHLLRDEMKSIEVTISSDYSPDLAEALIRGRLDVAFLRMEPGFDLGYEVVDKEPLIVLMPSDHRLTAREAIHPREFIGEIFIGGSNKATVLRKVTEDYLQRSGLEIKLDHGVDNMAMAMSLVASTRGLALMPAYARNLLPWSVVSRPLEGEAPTIELAVGYNRANSSPILELFLSRLGELRAHALTQKH
jgi:LysR family transcriptional regulator, hca operon transcriptional activator